METTASCLKKSVAAKAYNYRRNSVLKFGSHVKKKRKNYSLFVKIKKAKFKKKKKCYEGMLDSCLPHTFDMFQINGR